MASCYRWRDQRCLNAEAFKDGCTDFNVALEVGKKIQVLQVATCQASSEEDKRLAPDLATVW